MKKPTKWDYFDLAAMVFIFIALIIYKYGK